MADQTNFENSGAITEEALNLTSTENTGVETSTISHY